MTMFEIGGQVVCTHLSGGDPRAAGFHFIVNGIYTVREVLTHSSWGTVCALRFEEIGEPSGGGWHSGHFRPVRKTNIDIFRKIVADLPVELDINV